MSGRGCIIRQAGLLAVVLATGVPACGTRSDPAWLRGDWVFTAESAVTLSCGTAAEATSGLGNAVARINETPSGLALDLGCRCQLQLAAEGTLAGGAQTCNLVVAAQMGSATSQTYDVTARVDAWTISAPDGPDAPVREVVASGVAAPSATSVSFPCTFSLVGRLDRTPPRRPACGPRSTAVGVMPYFSGGLQICPVGAGTDGLFITMADDNQTGCGAALGQDGEDVWAFPDARKHLRACTPSGNITATVLPFCRVDGSLFHAPSGAGSSYAVLKLGDECPSGSVPVRKFIDNDNTNRRNAYLGDIAPNQSINDVPPLGTSTLLHFCLFRGSQQEDGAAFAFPDLGIPYAVFHDFDGPQPGWVMSKRWIRSDDESEASNSNGYLGPDDSPVGAAVEQLRTMVEDDDTNTIFDVARVH